MTLLKDLARAKITFQARTLRTILEEGSTMTDFNPEKPVQTRLGLQARIICTDAVGVNPIIALVTDAEGHELIRSYTAIGRHSKHHPCHELDLVNVPKKHERWVNIYPATGTVYVTKHEADVAGGFSRLACVRIECEEGDGL